MKWFNNKQKQLEMIQALRPTSKATLKMQCLVICKADIEEASKLYDFFAKDMPGLPDYDPAPQTWVDNTREMANGLMEWVRQNQDTLSQAYGFIQQVVARRGQLPDIPSPEAPQPLPPINE